MAYQRHAVSKAARKAHKRREKKRKALFGGMAAFAYTDSRGVAKRRLARASGRFH